MIKKNCFEKKNRYKSNVYSFVQICSFLSVLGGLKPLTAKALIEKKNEID